VTNLIVEADGGSRGNPGPAAYGAVVLDSVSGQLLAEVADYLGIETNNVAEYEGLTAGLRAARRLDPDAKVVARLDSRLVVEQMSGGWAIRNERLRRLALEAKAVLPAGQVRFEWVPRAQNKRADSLVNRSLDAVAAGRPGRIEVWHRLERVEGVEAGPAEQPEELSLPAGPAAEGATPTDLPVIVGWSRADLGDPTTLLLVRHGATQHSLEHRFSGWGGVDPGLVDLGFDQAGAVAEELERRGGADIIVTSPLLRARQTAQVIADRLGRTDVVVVDGLAEADFGAWDALSFSEVRHGWPGRLTAWLTAPDIPPPGGEAYTTVQRRATEARADLLRRFPRQRIVAVSHTTPIKGLVQSVLQAPPASIYRFELAPGSLTTLASWGDGVATIIGLGEVGHLHGVMHDTA
jgi:broad specificity phosphatase PhoE/ribonuclease HI